MLHYGALENVTISRAYHHIHRGDNDAQIFGYDARHVAFIQLKNDGYYYVSIQKINGYERTMPVKLTSTNNTILAFFLYNGRDYAWIKDRNSIIKSKIISPPDIEEDVMQDFDLVSFDHLKGDLLLFKSRTLIFYHFSRFLNRNQEVEPIRTVSTNLTCGDIMYVNGDVFCTENFSIYRISPADGYATYISKYFVNRFQFVLFLKSISTLSICSAGLDSKQLDIILYMVDVLLIIAVIYLLRVKTRNGTFLPLTFQRRRPHMNEEEMIKLDSSEVVKIA
jgi:hypothetical protein